jgi:hypothetical protein
MSAVATSPIRIMTRVFRWSQAGHEGARPNSDPSALVPALSAMKAILILAQVGPGSTSAAFHATVALSRNPPTVNAAIKSP